jgi:hypothetical protein
MRGGAAGAGLPVMLMASLEMRDDQLGIAILKLKLPEINDWKLSINRIR